MSNNMLEQRNNAPATVSRALETPAVKSRINDLLGKKAPQFASSVIAISNLPGLADCEPMSVIGSAITAATLDLPINQSLGFAHIVPYNNRTGKRAQFQIGYKGFIQLALRSGQYLRLNDCVIPNGGLKSYNELTGELDVDFDAAGDGDPDGYAFYFKLVNGFEKTVFWSFNKTKEHARRYSQAYRKGYGPWKDDFDAMGLKTVIKNTLSKYGILSVELQRAIESDQGVIDVTQDDVEYVDNQNDTGIKMESPKTELPKKDEKREADSAKKGGDNKETRKKEVKDVSEMHKRDLLKEVSEHQEAPYFRNIYADMMPDSMEPVDCGVTILRPFVAALREANGGGNNE